MLKTKIVLLDSLASVPTRALEEDTGYDLKMIGFEKLVGDVIFFKTGIAVQPPPGYYWDIVPRSSISKLPLELANSVGIIDRSYTGEILIPIRVTHPRMGQGQPKSLHWGGMVKIFDSEPRDLKEVAYAVLNHKPTLCQMILRKKLDTEFQVVDSLAETKRGSGGFGSTD